MKIQIENLKAQMRGIQLSDYQKALALDEYYKLLDYVEELGQKIIHQLKVSDEELAICKPCNCEWCQGTGKVMVEEAVNTPKVSDEELAVMVSNAMQQDEHIAWDSREIKLLGDMIRAKYEAQ